MKKIGILGAGTWGIALAQMLSTENHDVQVWSALPQEIDTLEKNRQHPNLKGVTLSEKLRYTKEISEVCQGKDLLVFAVPSPFVRSTARAARRPRGV